MPEMIRAKGGSLQARLRKIGLWTGAAVGALSLASGAVAQDATRWPFGSAHLAALARLDRHEIAALTLILGVLFFAVVTAVLLVRTHALARAWVRTSRTAVTTAKDRTPRIRVSAAISCRSSPAKAARWAEPNGQRVASWATAPEAKDSAPTAAPVHNPIFRSRAWRLPPFARIISGIPLPLIDPDGVGSPRDRPPDPHPSSVRVADRRERHGAGPPLRHEFAGCRPALRPNPDPLEPHESALI